MFASQEYLANLKKGDVAVITGGGFGIPERIGKVIGVTPSGRIKVKLGSAEYRFNKYGEETGGHSSFHRCYLVEATPEKIAEIRAAQARRTLLRRVAETKWSDLGTDTLERVVAILDEEKG